jgi:hypothetical protein
VPRGDSERVESEGGRLARKGQGWMGNKAAVHDLIAWSGGEGTIPFGDGRRNRQVGEVDRHDELAEVGRMGGRT